MLGLIESFVVVDVLVEEGREAWLSFGHSVFSSLVRELSLDYRSSTESTRK